MRVVVGELATTVGGVKGVEEFLFLAETFFEIDGHVFTHRT